MVILKNWKIYVLIYLISTVIYNDYYKLVAMKMKQASALTILLQVTAGFFSLLLIPFFSWKLPADNKVYLFLGISVIFYAIQDRLSTTARSKLEASTYGILKQISTVFMIILGFLFFKEPWIWKKILGSFLILFSNVLVFYQRKSIKNIYSLIIGILANLCLGIALFFDVNSSNFFNLSFYVSITLFIPSFLIFIFSKVTVKDLIIEYHQINHVHLLIISIHWMIMMHAKLMAYQLGQVTVVAPLCSLGVVLNVIISYFCLKEKDHMIKKIFASILIILGVFLIKS